MSKRDVILTFAATLGFNLVAGLFALRWVTPLFPSDPVQYLFGFIVAAIGYTAALALILKMTKEAMR